MASKQPGHPGLDPSVADKLLELLSKDDGFRQNFQKNPAQALAQLGHAPAEKAVSAGDATAAFACMITKNIATKEEIQAAREELHRYLTAGGNHTNPHAFEAGQVMDALQRKPPTA